MSPIKSQLGLFYPTSKSLSQERYKDLWETTLSETGEVNDRSELQQIYETTQPLMGNDRLEAGVLYLMTDRPFSINTSVLPMTTSRFIMVAWNDYGYYRTDLVTFGKATMWYRTTEPLSESLHNKFISGPVKHIYARTVLEWFSNEGGRIYPIHNTPQELITLNYSTQGFDVGGLN